MGWWGWCWVWATGLRPQVARAGPALATRPDRPPDPSRPSPHHQPFPTPHPHPHPPFHPDSPPLGRKHERKRRQQQRGGRAAVSEPIHHLLCLLLLLGRRLLRPRRPRQGAQAKQDEQAGGQEVVPRHLAATRRQLVHQVHRPPQAHRDDAHHGQRPKCARKHQALGLAGGQQ